LRRYASSVDAPGVVEDWPEPVVRVTTALREAGAEARVEEFPEGTSTAEEAARAIGCELRQIVKSLLFDCNGTPALVLVPGDRRADPRKVATLMGAAKARIAGSAEVEDATGYAPGAVAPFPLRRVEHVLIDRSLLGESVVWTSAGTSRHVAGLPATELVRVSRARPVDVVLDD
jgi:prolyl-tRNA editing enzyme YbaK/EbsC (Cys-tRNA(Pro) deacylase)